jgi:hypothetical protein
MMDLLAYIKGKRRGKEAHRIEKKAMSDPFMADALDGFDAVKGDHAKRIDELRARVSKKVNRSYHVRAWVGAAACLLFCIGIGGYFWLKPEPENMIVKSDTQQLTAAAPNVKTTEEKADGGASPEKHMPMNGNGGLARKTDKNLFAQASVESKERAVEENVVEKTQMMPQTENDMTASDIKYDDKLRAKTTVNAPQARVAPSESGLSVRGKVVDGQGEPVVGASVMSKSSKRRTTTDLNGQFTLPVTSEDSSLTASFIGYTTEESPVDTRNSMLLALHEDNRALAEIAVVGYGISKKKAATPEPVIGMKAYRKYLKESLRRPTGECAAVKGTVKVAFRIDAEGKPYNVKIKQSLCAEADKEAIRLIGDGCRWKGANGAEVTLKVRF